MASFVAESQRTYFYSTTECVFGVHFCYNGLEIQNTLIGHLKHAFCERRINTTIDDHWNTRGEEISQATLKAIEKSKSSILVFCENFPSSTRCLDELVKIVELEKKGQLVRVLYFRIDQSEVLNQGGSYKQAMARHRENVEDIKVMRWEVALHDAAKLPGRTYTNGCQAKLVQEIVEDISGILNHTPLYNAACSAGLQSHITEPHHRLDPVSCDVDTVRKKGIGEIGAECNVACQNFPNAAPLKPFFKSSSRKEADNGDRSIMVQQPSTNTGSAYKDMGKLLCPNMTDIMPCDDLLNVLHPEGNGMKKRKWLWDGVQFNVGPNSRQKQTWAPAEIEFLRLLDSTSRARLTPRGIEDGLILTEPKGNNFGSLNDFAYLSTEKSSMSAVQDAESVAARTNEVKSAMQTLQTFVSKKFSELIPEGLKFMEHIENKVLSFRADEKISQDMVLVFEKIRLSFTRWSQEYEKANNVLETTNADLSKSDQLQKDFEAAVIESRLAVSAEEEHWIRLDHLQRRKRELEEALKAVEVEMKDCISSCQRAADRKRLLLGKGTMLKTEKDNLELRLPRIKGEHAAAKFTQENIEAEWSNLAKMFNETYTLEFGWDGEH